jgi:ribonucleases P/MRP protein subunit RPP40
MFFMQLSLSLSLPLSIIFNKSLSENKFPSKWKTGFVSPIFKEGDKSKVINYRPVSILCAMSKIFERLVFIKLFDSVKLHIHHSQHGFFEKRSTQTNLMEYVSAVADAIISGGQVDTVYTDFAKAFDKVDHGILLVKLRSFGLQENLVKWFSTYLRDRSQFVVIGGYKSNRIIPTSGVPQGSILGPLLFIIFINDLLASLSSCSGFADDLKVYRSISSDYDCELLQEDLTKIIDWCRRNNMSLNVDKCAVMSTTHSRNKILFPYTIGNDILKRVSTKKDLGIIMDDKLPFNEHVDEMTRKAYKMLGFILRCGRYFSNQSSMRLLYFTLVRNRLEYCSTIWNPCYSNASDQIERVQKKFTRMFYFKFRIAHPRPPYYQRLKHLKLRSLETRRLENDEIMLYKLIHNHVDSALSQRISFHQPTRTTRQDSIFYLLIIKRIHLYTESSVTMMCFLGT